MIEHGSFEMELTESEMRTVFDAFDEHKEGVISTDRFLLLAQEYFGSANREVCYEDNRPIICLCSISRCCLLWMLRK